MHGIVTSNVEFASEKAVELGIVCFGIVLGYMIVEVVNRFIWKPFTHK